MKFTEKILNDTLNLSEKSEFIIKPSKKGIKMKFQKKVSNIFNNIF